MDNGKFVELAKSSIVEAYNKRKGSLSKPITKDNLYVVWLARALQNNKALLSTNIDGDGLYFEVTHNGDKNEIYLDIYKKQENKAIKV